MSDEITTTTTPAGDGQSAEVRVVVEERKQSRGCCLGRIVSAGVSALVVFIILANAVAPYRVGGNAMQPTLRDQQTILAHTPRFLNINIHLPNRGEIVLYHPNDHPDTITIGRVIAIPGDTIEVDANSVILNGKPLTESYIAAAPAGQDENPQTYPSTKLGANLYFIMGDNRPNSRDSRNFGPVSFDHITGEVWIMF